MEQGQQKSIRLLIIGDQNVGKSSLIYAMISQLPSHLQKTLRRVILPPDLCIYSQKIFTQLIDTSYSQTDFEKQFKEADLAILVYDVSQQQTIDRLKTYWLPMIQKQAPKLSVIIVGNKLDKIQLAIQQQENYKHVKDILKQVTQQFPQVQMGIECSAYYDRNVKSVLNCAQRAVLYPLTPLYNLKSSDITPKFKRALIRIFRILDKDMDGKLSDMQLATLQQRVFKYELQADDIRFIKDMINSELEQINQDYITFDGFLTLNKKCIKMLKIQMPWSILRHFRYNNNLQLNIPQERFVLQHGQSLELSSKTIQFLVSIFNKASRISQDPMEFIFRCSPSLYRPIDQFNDVHINLQKFILGWNYLCFIDYIECYKQLSYIGFEHQMGQTFKKTHAKTTLQEIKKIKQRKILSVCMIDNRSYTMYLNGLFQNGKQQNFDKQDHFIRKIKIYGKQNHSKIFILFRVDPRNLKEFLNSKIGKHIDLIMYFEGRQQQAFSNITSQEIRSLMMNETTLVKMIDSQFAKNKLHVFDLSLDLEALPVRYNQQKFDELYKLCLQTFSNIQLGLSRETVATLKSKQRNKILWGIATVGGISLGIGVIFLISLKRLK